jgi:hypothetical protein
MAAYDAIVRGRMPDLVQTVRGEPGTFDRLAHDYFASPDFPGLASSSRRT